MSVRPSSQNNTSFSLKSGLYRCDEASSLTTRDFGDFSSDESDCVNVDFHRPKCPWGRRRSYLQKVKKTAILDSSVACVPGRNQSPVAKKPWLNSSIPMKNNDCWQRPMGKKKGGVHCFCTRKEQAKITPLSRKLCTPDWIETRRNHIVNKFDGFSKNVLKITGKLSQETISMITAKIRENLEKNSDLNLQHIYNSSIKLARNKPYPKIKETDLFLHGQSSKVLPESPCIKVSLMPSEMNIFVDKKDSSCNIAIPVNNESLVNNTDSSVINSVEENRQSTKDKNDDPKTVVLGYGRLFKDEKLFYMKANDSVDNAKNQSDSGKIVTFNEKYASGDKSIFISDKNNYLDSNELIESNNNKITFGRERSIVISEIGYPTGDKILVDRPTSVSIINSRLVNRPASVGKNSYLNERPASVGNKNSYLTERPSSFGNKNSYLLERPKSVGDKSLEKPKSRGDKTSCIIQRPASGGIKCFHLSERSVAFEENSLVGDNASTVERPDSARDKPPQHPLCSWTGHKPSQFYAKCLSMRNNAKLEALASSNNDKPTSAGDKILRPFDSPTAENKFLNTYETNLSVGDGMLINSNSAACTEISMSASDKTPQPILNFSSKNETSLFQDKSVSFGENIYINDNSPNYNYYSKPAGDETPQSILNLPTTIETPSLHEKNVSFGNSTFVEHGACDINEKPMSSSRKTSKAVENFSIRNKLSHFDDKPLSTGDKIKSLLDVTAWSPDDKNLCINERPTLAYRRKKQDQNFLSKVNVMKSSLDIVKSTQPGANKNVTSVQSRNSLQLSARRKILLERNVKKKCVQQNSNDHPTGYTVQLVKLKNYHRIGEHPNK